MQSAHFDIIVDLLLKCPRGNACLKGYPSNITSADSDNPRAALPFPSAPTHRARGIIDISRITLADVPLALEEKLRKSKGIFSAQLNAFSKKLTVEFDPSIITLDKIRKTVTRPL
jgi:hypothetical protein